MSSLDSSLHFALKVASRCNLNCSYCYVYNKGDETWRQRPSIMPAEVFDAAIERIRRHCARSGQRSVRIVFHGGEPCLAGADRFAAWCELLRTGLAGTRTHFSLQTNGTLLDEAWVDVLRAYRVTVGISIDGPRARHDTFRVDHAGRGSYDAVARGLAHLRRGAIPIHVLSVIQLGADPLVIHRHLVELGADSIDYLCPDFTHDTIATVRRLYGATPCADYLIPIFDHWWQHGTVELRIGIFVAIARAILGGESQVDFLGNRPFGFLFVETDGAIEGLDVMRICKNGLAQTGLNVLTDDFHRVAEVSEVHRDAIFDGMPLPSACHSCPERDTCAGGYLPHRFSTTRAFDNPSVWCPDLLRLFEHVRARLGTSVEETRLRRQVLGEMNREQTPEVSPCSP
jgi:uncharacterized protein